MVAGEVLGYAMESAYKVVERNALAHTEAKDNPKAILLGGQPGSGKSALSAEAAYEFVDKGGAVLIDADRMREESPRYKQLSKEDPQNAADRTHKEAAEWATRLTVAAVAGRRNLVVDSTMRNPENIRELASRLKANGYEVEARVMAVNPEISMTRARLRFEQQVAERGTGRFVNREQHDAAYTGMVESVRILEREKLAGTVCLYDANQRPVYENKLERGEWQKAPDVVQALQQERSREWTHAERRDYVFTRYEINTLTTRRESASDKMVYAMGTVASDESKEYQNAHEAAKAFKDAPPAQTRPYEHEIACQYGGPQAAYSPAEPALRLPEARRTYHGPIISMDGQHVIQSVREGDREHRVRHERLTLSSTSSDLLKVGSVVEIRYPYDRIGIVKPWGDKAIEGRASRGIEPKGLGR